MFKIQNVWYFGFRILILFGIWYFGLGISFINAQVTYEGTNIPYIHPRSEWLTTPELRNLFTWYPYNPKEGGEIPDYYPVQQIILHDTGCNPSHPGCNDESLPTPAILQNTFRFHAVTRGWGDIGYHFIIDRKGEIWEGRYGGNGVRGAHLYNSKACQNFNVGSVGITLIGNYANAAIPPVMIESLNRLIAWIGLTNNIDVASSPTISVWTNPKDAAGKCTADSGGFTSNFTGPLVLTHRDIEPANSDVQNINMAGIRVASATLADDLKAYAFQEVGGDTIFDIVQAKLQQAGATTKKIATIIKTQLDYFRPELFARKPEPKVASTPSAKVFADGTLLKPKNKEEVYIIKNQKRIHISSAALFSGLGLKWDAIQEEDEPVVSSLALDVPIVFPNGVLIQAGTPDVYYITNSKRYLISSPSLFAAYTFKWEDIVQITLGELDRYYPWGGYVKWPDGTLLQNQFNKDQVVVVKGETLEAPKEKLTAKTPLQLVNGREIASYQTASLATPTFKLALSQAFDSVKNALGITQSAQAKSPSSETGSDGSSNGQTQIPQPSTPAPQPQAEPASQAPQPAIKIALCKTRNTGGDVNKCAFTSQDALEITQDANGISTVKGYEDRPGFNADLNDNEFRGKVYTTKTDDGKVWLINELPLEEYLKGIAETLGTDTPEYRKLLIVIARSYAYNYIAQDKKYPDVLFHLTNTAFDQLYRGYAYEKRSNGLPQVVDGSKGEVILFDGKVIVGAYSSDSGGVTKSACPKIFPKYCDEAGNLKSQFAYLKGGAKDPEGTIHDPSKIAASHGVGMSAIGARKLIELEKSYKEVIKYYYEGVEIQKMY